MKEEEIEKKRMKIERTIGWIITIIGFAFLFIKAFGSMTGFVISESVHSLPDYTYLIGLAGVVVGVVILLSSGIQELVRDVEEEIEKALFGKKRRKSRFKSTSSLRKHNRQAKYWMKEIYNERYGEYPTEEELKAFMRPYHDKHSLNRMISSFRKRKVA